MRAIVSRPLVVLMLAAAAPCALAGDLHVPADYSTIQAAIDAASSGDVVLVDPGTYFECLDFKGKAIRVASTGGAAVTTINASQKGSVVSFTNNEQSDSILEGFTLTNGLAVVGGGVQIEFASPTIRRNVITGNHVDDNGGGIGVSHGSPVIVNNVISWNSTGHDGGGITIGVDCPDIQFSSNLVVWNAASEEGGGIHFIEGTSRFTPLTNVTIVGNSAPHGAGIYLHWSSSTLVTNSILWQNSNSEIELENGTCAATVENSDISSYSWTGTGVINVNPDFVDLANYDFHLAPGSPCVDAGSDSSPNITAEDIDLEQRIMGAHIDMGSDEWPSVPFIASVSPHRGNYAATTSVAISGGAFTAYGPITVRFGAQAATNVVVTDDAHLTCDVPAGAPGAVDVGISNSLGEGVLPAGFAYTPAVTIEGDTTIGSSITIHDLCDPGDGIFAVYGLPPAVSVPTPPFDGDLAIVPFHYFFYVTTWPFDSFDVPATIPNDPALVGVDVLLQSLIGPQLTKPPKDGRWTNCAVLSIK